jgi:cellulose synthase operon protein C
MNSAQPCTLRWLAAALVGLLAQTTPASARLVDEESDRAFARARFAWAAQDTAGAVRALEEVLASDGSAPTRARAIVLLQILDGAITTTENWPSTGSAAWHVALGADAPLPSDAMDDPAVRLLLAARALDAGDEPRASQWLRMRKVPETLRGVHAHLVSRCAVLRGEPEDLGGPFAARAELLALLAASSPDSQALDARLAQWLRAHPDHPVSDRARAERVALALDSGDPVRARELALERRTYLSMLRAELIAALGDTAATARALWHAPSPARLRFDEARWSAALEELVGELFARDAQWPAVHDALRPAHVDPRAVEFAGPELRAEDRARDAVLGTSITAARRTAARAHEAYRRLTRELDARRAYHERGARELEAVGTSLRAVLDELEELHRRGPSLLTDLRAVEDTLLARIEGRGRALAGVADRQAQWAGGLHWLYVEGPMVRRDPAPRNEVPRPDALLRGEERLAREAATALDSLRVHSRDLVRRSFSDVFRHRVTSGTSEAAERARALLARGDELHARLTDTLRALSEDPRLAASEQAVRAAEGELASLVVLRDAHRRDAAARAVEDALAKIDAEHEGLLYTLAVATNELATTGQDESASVLRSEARALWSELLARDPDSRVRGDARYRWADLELVIARADFQRRMGEWLGEGGADRRALAPLLDIEPALDLFRAILAEDATFARRDLVLFQLGMLHADRGDDEAAAYLAQLVDEHPDSPVLQEAHLRRGELAFDAGAHREAIVHLGEAARGDDTQVRAIALYKLGWSAHGVGDTDLAVDAFLRLVDLYAEPTSAPQRVDLAREARALLLRSLARDGGAESFARTFDAVGERGWAPDLLGDLSELLTGYALFEQAEEADRMFLRRYADHDGALAAAERLVLGAEQRAGPAAGDAARLSVLEHFVHDGDWSRTRTDAELRVRADTFARECLLAVAVRQHQRARDAGDAAHYRTALAHYDRLVTGWPTHEEAFRWNLLAGECAREAGAYEIALDRFARAAVATTEIGTQAAWEHVVTADLWYRTSVVTASTNGDDALARQLMHIGDAYTTPDPQRAADLRWRLLQIALAHGWDDEVVARTASFALHHDRDPRRPAALHLLAEAHYRQRSFDVAAAAFERAMDLAVQAGADSLANALRPWIAHSEDLHAESLAADPQRGPLAAAHAWRALASRWPDAEMSDRALYRAGLAFAENGMPRDAVDVWTRLLDRHPQSEFTADTHRNLARHLEENGDLVAAAAAIERFAGAFSDAEDAGPALLHAAALYERSGETTKRSLVLDRYLARYPEDVDTRRWVLEERAHAELDRGTEGENVRAVLQFADTSGQGVSPVLLARIGSQQAERLATDFESIPLTQPLNHSLERKRDALTRLLAAHREVAAHGVRPYAQAAAFGIGAALVHMADALRASERPAGLGGDDLLAYDEILEGQAFEFSERGETAWRELLVHHHTGDDPAVDPWIARTREALFPRTAQRFLHQPSFEYPVLGADGDAR